MRRDDVELVNPFGTYAHFSIRTSTSKSTIAANSGSHNGQCDGYFGTSVLSICVVTHGSVNFNSTEILRFDGALKEEDR